MTSRVMEPLTEPLTEKEVQVLGHIAQHASVSQRALAKTTGISLGLVNLILKRFIKTGYLKVARLNKRQLEYVLTPEGFLETARRSYSYATRTIRSYNALQTRITDLIHQLIQQGYRDFAIHGDGELSHLIASIMAQQLPGNGLHRDPGVHGSAESVVLNVGTEMIEHPTGGAVVNVLEKIGWQR